MGFVARNKRKLDEHSSFNQIAEKGNCFAWRHSGFCSFSISRLVRIIVFSNPNSYITHWIRGEEGSYHVTLNMICSINLSYISDILGKISS